MSATKVGGCCRAGKQDTARARPRVAEPRLRLARAVAGVIFLLVAGVLIAFVHSMLVWPLSVLAGWVGLSHLVAAATGYPGCPELGAVPSLVLRRPLPTRCGPWERVDGWIRRG